MLSKFFVEVIASHADLCADAFDPVGEILEPTAVDSDCDSNVNADANIPSAETASQRSSLSKVQAIVAQLQIKIRLIQCHKLCQAYSGYSNKKSGNYLNKY